jgi:hypothetical protein
MLLKPITTLLLLTAICTKAASFGDSVNVRQQRCKKMVVGAGIPALQIASLAYLNESWYKQHSTGNFHFFDDNAEWLQMDKAGHLFTTYQLGRLCMQAFDEAGYSRNQKLFLGGGLGLVYMTAVELMDGFSDGWGFSWGDQAANFLGTTMAISQEALWGKQHLQLKFTYRNSGLAPYRSSLLGENLLARILKDYNAQTYWLSFNPFTFSKNADKWLPWLNLSFGYNAYGMLGARDNHHQVQDEKGNPLHFSRERNFLFSLDLDLTRIKTKSKFLKGMFSVLNVLKIPAPALQFNGKQFTSYWLY